MSHPTSKLWRTLSWPNRISILRLLLVAPFVVCLLYQNDEGFYWTRYVALALYIVMALSDAADGLLARKLNVRTRLGAILDPLADKTLVILSVVLLSLPGSQVPGHRLHTWLVVAVVGKDLWVIVGFLVIYLVTDRLLARPTVFGKLATVGMCLLAPVVLVSPELDLLAPNLGRCMTLGCEVLVTVLCILAVASYTRLGLAFTIGREKPIDEERRNQRPNHGPH